MPYDEHNERLETKERDVYCRARQRDQVEAQRVKNKLDHSREETTHT